MPKPKKKFKVEGLAEAKKAIEKLDRKLQAKILKKIHRKLLTPIKKEIANAAPNTPNNNWKNPRNISILAVKRDPTGVQASYKQSPETWVVRFHERGTKVRKRRGKISARPWIFPTHKRFTPKVIKRAEKEYANLMEKALISELRLVTKKIGKLK